MFDQIYKIRTKLRSRLTLANATLLFVLVVGVSITPKVMERWKSKILIESIRSNCGFVETHSLVPQKFAGYLPHSLKSFFENIESISVYTLDNSSVDDNFIETLGNQPYLESLTLGNARNPTSITNLGTSCLAKYKLNSLEILGSKISDAGFNEIGNIQTLFLLEIQDSDISGEHLNLKSLFKNLEYLDVRGSKLTNQGLRQLSSLPKIRWLNISETCVNDEGFRYLPKFQKLDYLIIDKLRIKNISSISDIAKMKHLRHLSMKGSSIDDEGVKYLASAKQILFLWLNNSRLTDEALIHLAKMKNLMRLDLSETLITDDGLNHLVSLDKLMWLDLKNTKISDKAEKDLLLFPKLIKLDVRGTKMSSAAIQSLRSSGVDVESNESEILQNQ